MKVVYFLLSTLLTFSEGQKVTPFWVFWRFFSFLLWSIAWWDDGPPFWTKLNFFEQRALFWFFHFVTMLLTRVHFWLFGHFFFKTPKWLFLAYFLHVHDTAERFLTKSDISQFQIGHFCLFSLFFHDFRALSHQHDPEGTPWRSKIRSATPKLSK